MWTAGAGLSYRRLEPSGLQWPCPAEDHPGTQVLHRDRFASGPRAGLRRIDFLPSPEATSDAFPFVLVTGRTLYQFNAGTMTARTPNQELRPRDVLAMAPADAARLGLESGARVRVRSRHGETVLPVSLDDRVAPGQLFATFHTVEASLNRLTSSHRDGITDTPEYKVTAVQLQREA